MNIREFNKTADFYALEPPWFSENSNAIVRIFRLKKAFDGVFDSLDEVEEIENKLEEDEAKPEDVVFDFQIAVHEIVHGLEEFYYCFPEVVNEEWFHSLWQSSAGAYWRAEEGRFKENPEGITYYVSEIVDHIPSGQEPGPYRNLEAFLNSRGSSFRHSQVDALFKEDVYEARDHIAIGYYSTALLVLGRAVEKALLKIGQERKIERIKKGEQRSWDEATFSDRTEALANADHPNGDGKMISQKQYLEISILIDYRNNVAHTEYESIEREEAIRKCETALDLLKELSGLLEEIRGIDDEEIKELTVRVQ